MAQARFHHHKNSLILQVDILLHDMADHRLVKVAISITSVDETFASGLGAPYSYLSKTI